ncbi:hypothetical protein QAD02_015824 [Eretmocerus hayati]|uniref:Uncharacterized protein n=1 Tax=Eretmocerus hayati TaxID=131215 RepID=A0ACC2PC66_9HYME|nr:hypothetical protein QAD02_015824 [Eretmocerus hayati]
MVSRVDLRGYEPGLSSRTGSNAGLPASPSLTSANSNNPGKISIINGKMSLGSAANFGSRTSLVEPNSGTVEDSDENTSEDGGSSDELEYAMPAMPKPPLRHDEQTVYVIEFETEPDAAKGDGHRNRAGKGLPHDGTDLQSPLDPWSIVWYIGSFGGLVAFFLIVSCSEWCCRRGARPLSVPYTQRGEVLNAQPLNDSSPPPPYHLFAPPPYDSVNYGDNCYQGMILDHQPRGTCSWLPGAGYSVKQDYYWLHQLQVYQDWHQPLVDLQEEVDHLELALGPSSDTEVMVIPRLTLSEIVDDEETVRQNDTSVHM